MINTKTLLSVVAMFAAASGSFAQGVAAPAPAASTAGLLGQRYVNAGLFTENIRRSSLDNAFGGGLGLNLPLTANLDVSFGYSHERLDDTVDFRENAVNVSVTPYTQLANSGVKLFADATLGFAWSETKFGAFTADDDSGFYAVGFGAEIPVATRTAITTRVAFNDTFESGNNDAWTIGAGVNHWFTEKIAGLAGVTFVEDDSIIYSIGAAFRF